MTDEELSQIFTQLGAVLVEVKLGWLLSDVEYDISRGREVERKIPTLTSSLKAELGDRPQRKGKSATFITTVPYTNLEKLMLLIDAIEAVTVGLPKGLTSCLSSMSNSKSRIGKLVFCDDKEGSDERDVFGDFSDYLAMEKHSLMKKLLGELREAANAD